MMADWLPARTAPAMASGATFRRPDAAARRAYRLRTRTARVATQPPREPSALCFDFCENGWRDRTWP